MLTRHQLAAIKVRHMMAFVFRFHCETHPRAANDNADWAA